MNYGEVALGVECALPAGFEARMRERRSRGAMLWLILVLAAAAAL
jgi:hypothetical protein